MSELSFSTDDFRELEDWELDFVTGGANTPVITISVRVENSVRLGLQIKTTYKTTTIKYPDGRIESSTETSTEIVGIVTLQPK